MLENALKLIDERKFVELARLLKDENAADVGLLLEELDPALLPVVYRILPKELAAETFVEMDTDSQTLLIHSFSDRELREILDDLFLDDTVDVIEEMPAGVVKRILKNSDAETRRSINEILQYPEDSAGTIMTIEYVDLKRDMTVAQAFERIRKTGYDKETIYNCYVTDGSRRLEGIVTVRTLLLTDMNAVLSDIMDERVISVGTHDDQEYVARQFEKYDFLAIPVVDTEGRLVGIVTFDDAMDVIREENTEDLEKMNALVPSEDSYFNVGIFRQARNRIPWLVALMLAAMVTGLLINHYESAFAAIPLLVSFIPMLSGSGGNCGAQASALVIRGLALNEINTRDLLRVWGREIRVALVVGSALGLINFCVVYFMYRRPLVALVTGMTMAGICLVAKSLGCLMPIVAKKLRLDPALMSSPIISSLTDCCCILIYFNIAVGILGI